MKNGYKVVICPKFSSRRTSSGDYGYWKLHITHFKAGAKAVNIAINFMILVFICNIYVLSTAILKRVCFSLVAAGASCGKILLKLEWIRMTETRFYEPVRLSTPPKPLFLLKTLDPSTWLVAGGAGRTGGGRGTSGRGTRDGRRKGGKPERNSQRQAFVICYCLSSSQKRVAIVEKPTFLKSIFCKVFSSTALVFS